MVQSEAKIAVASVLTLAAVMLEPRLHRDRTPTAAALVIQSEVAALAVVAGNVAEALQAAATDVAETAAAADAAAPASAAAAMAAAAGFVACCTALDCHCRFDRLRTHPSSKCCDCDLS